MDRDDAPLVDTHFHVWRTKHPLIKAAWHRKLTDAPTELLIETLDAHGVVFGVIAGASIYGNYNDYLRASMRKHKRLRGTAVVDPNIDIYQLERMKEDGFVGIRFVWSVRARAPDMTSDEYRILLQRAADLDMHVHLTDHDDTMESTIKAIENAGARIVIDHLGLLDTPQGINGKGFKAILAALDRGRTWVKLSGGFRFSSPEAAAMYARELVRVTGGDRLFWGSDWPFAAYETAVTYADTIAALKSWVSDPALRRRITGENALRFYFT